MRNLFWITLTALATFLLPLSACALSSSPTNWSRANRAYQDGNWEQAVENYQAIVAGGVEDAALDYNLANAYSQLGDLGRSRLFYERAQRLAPRDGDIGSNLALLKARLVDKEATQEAPHFSPNEMMAVASLLWFAASALGVIWFKRRGPGWGLLALLSFSLLIGLAGTILQTALQERRLAVVIPSEIKVFQGPGRDFSALPVALHAGTRVSVQNSQGDWRRISAPGLGQGWVRSEQIEKVLQSKMEDS